MQNTEQSGFFSLSVYKEHVKSRIMQLFGVRDNQIRMLLLTHFAAFVHVFSHEELSMHILPEVCNKEFVIAVILYIIISAYTHPLCPTL